MIQYNLRLDEKLKERAKKLAQKRGLSENLLYQMAIDDFIHRSDAEDFFSSLMNRLVTDREKTKLLAKLRANKAPVLFDEDKVI